MITESCDSCDGRGFTACSWRSEEECGLIFRYHKWYYYCVNGRLTKQSNCLTVSVLNGLQDPSGGDYGVCPGCGGRGVEVCEKCKGNCSLQRACPLCIGV
ncbi:MAG: hypothetical protein R3C18_13890 [Planctomycetaceae bacterium]